MALKEETDFSPFDDIPERSHVIIDTETERATEAALAMVEEHLFCPSP